VGSTVAGLVRPAFQVSSQRHLELTGVIVCAVNVHTASDFDGSLMRWMGHL
jgi:hypothetical protein